MVELTCPAVPSAPDDSTGVNIQADARSLNAHWGLPPLVALPARTTPVGNPRSDVSEAPATAHTVSSVPGRALSVVARAI